VYAVKQEAEGEERKKKKKLFALKRVVASSRECLEAARQEVTAARAAARCFSSSPSFSSSSALRRVVGLLPLVASEEKKNSTKEIVEVLLLFPFCAAGSLADVVQGRGKGGEEGRDGGKQEKREQLLSVAPLLRLFADVAEGLSRLHEGGGGEGEKLAHFDVKPHNIFLLRGEEGEEEKDSPSCSPFSSSSSSSSSLRALLGDWGSARRIPVRFASHLESLAVCEEAERSTTAAFRPPELWDPLSFAATSSCSSGAGGGGGVDDGGDGGDGGEKSTSSSSTTTTRRGRREISGKADVWSLGACLFACLGDGRSPSEVAAGSGGGGSLALAACSGRVEWPPRCSLPPPPPAGSSCSPSPSPSSSSSSSTPSVPSAAVRALVERCLSLDPEERPSAARFAAEARLLAEGIERERERERGEDNDKALFLICNKTKKTRQEF
jgi:serine/threonine protein kinase